MISGFVSQANKLRNVQMHLEHSVKCCGVSFDDENSINDLRERLSTDRFKECQDFRLSILNIAEPLNSLKLEVFNGKSFDLKQLKANLINIQERSKMAKEEAAKKIRLLSEQENVLTEEVFCLQHRMCEWRKSMMKVHKPKKKMPVKEASAKEPSKEVQTFAKFVQKSGGHENGWRVKDHNVFLKLRKKYSERGKMIAAVRSIFPDMSESDVENHEQWYFQYSKLQSEQNNAIVRWKAEQHDSRSKKEDVVICEKTRKAPIEDPRDVKERLLSWKEKKRRQLEEQQQLNSDLDERTRQMENSKKMKCEEAKLEIAKWKREKELQESRVAQQKLQEKLRKEEHLSLMDGKCLIKQFQCQDEVFLRRRLALREAKDAVGRAKSCERKVSIAAMHRNPERLLQPTKQWLSRFSKSADARYDRDKFWNVTEKKCKLGIPEWRKQMKIQ